VNQLVHGFFIFLIRVTQPLQIIFLTPGFPSDEADSSCIPALQDLVLTWKETVPEVSLKVISFQYPHQAKKYTWHEIPVYAAGGKDRTGLLRTFSWMKVFANLLLTKRKIPTILISYFLTEATYIGQLFSRAAGIKHIAIAAGQDVRKQNSYLDRIDFKNLYVVAFNEQMTSALFAASGKKADRIIPMGIRQTEPAISVKQDRMIDILMVGSLIPLKRIDLALQLIGELKNIFPGIKATIVGKGPERSRLEKIVTDLELETIVSFSGALNREEVFRKMQQSKILLHTSEYEGQSTVMTEALANGMTVVCFDVGRIGNHEKIYVCTNEDGMLATLKKLLLTNQFDFSPVIFQSAEATVKKYMEFIEVITSRES
jgi:glycosyltransferase involved in cell wall biosynthesis